MNSENYHPDVMIIDDALASLQLLQTLLQGMGYRVRPFSKGSLALKAAESEPPDLVLLDVKMPEMDGYQVCRQLKASKKLCDIPVLFISASNEDLDRLQALATGGVDYVSKPFRLPELRFRLQTHIRAQHNRRALKHTNERIRRAIEALRPESGVPDVDGALQFLEES